MTLEQELYESRQRCRLLVQSVKDHGIFMLDSQGCIANWNQNAEQILGYTESEILGQPFTHLFPPEMVGERAAELLTASTTGCAANDRWHVRKNGSRFMGSGTVTAVRDEQGAVRGFVAVLRDLTRERQLESALRDVPSYSSVITDTLSEPFVVLDEKLQVKLANRSFYQFFGASREETEDRFLFDLGNGQWCSPRLIELLDAVLNDTGVVADFIVKHTFPGIGLRIMSLNARRCFNHPELILLVFEDVTNVKLAETNIRRQTDELTANNRRNDEFLAMLSHELRNPLAPILSSVELLCLGSDCESEDLAKATIKRQVKHLARLIDDLREVSRIAKGYVRMDVQRTDLRPIVENAIQDIRHIFGERAHHLSISLPHDPLVMPADPDRLQQVIVNLLHNAVKYTDAGGSISLSLEREANQAVLRVRDTGIGISSQLLPHIFTKFLQGDTSLARSQGGLGIGLFLVRSIVEMHGGSVEARSAGEGKGSEFVVCLPVEPTIGDRFDSIPHSAVSRSNGLRRSERAEPPTRPDNSSRSRRGLRVLMVDDLVDTAKSLAMLLRRSGHDVRIAHSGPAALEAAAEYKPEVVLLDIGLPDMSGYEVARRIRQQPGIEAVPIISITSQNDDAHHRRSAEAGIGHHLTKPCSFSELESLLRQHCN